MGGAGGGSAGAGAGSFGCNPGCVAPQRCSAAGTCIDPGTCAVASDCSAGMQCDEATKTCVPGGDCGAQEAKVETVPPNMLLVLDRSCSMTALVGNVTKWDIAVAAINKMTTDYTGKIRFGLTLFPDLVTPNCQQAAIPIPVGPDNETAIQELLTAALAKADKYFPDGPCVTNIQTAVTQSTTEPAFDDTNRDRYAVLITDGKETCGSDATTEMEIKNLFEMRGIPTFVIGFGAGIDPAQMNKFAIAGGVPAAGANQYYDASDQASLDVALATIAKKTLSCAYTLDTVPPNPNEIYVFFDNTTEVSRDDTKTDGWTYDAGKNQVVFHGPACDSLKNGVVKDLDIVLGCQEPTPN
ncbi:VWA domain-containing protein [Polyangium fumosum]|uniref:VWA domain-containing protein n=2 Tax=Polyangium fumosum TaxID=889272 RepID=A0A4U1JES6_9BACT|nr:VWA domain-containing protein [Polyangium fumosum]